MKLSNRYQIANLKTNFRSLKTWILTWRTFPVISWIRAADLFRRGRYEAAAKQYISGLERNPRHPARHCAMMDLARCLYADGKIVESEKYLRKLSVQLPHSRRVHTALFNIQLRSGLSLDAAWTMRRACRYIIPDEELIGLYLYCVVENGGPSFLLNEVMKLTQSLEQAGTLTLLIKAAKLRLALDKKGYANKYLKKLELFAEEKEAGIEVILLAAEALLRAGKVASSRRLLRKALKIDPGHPRILSLFAETYLRAGPFYNPEFALQLAQDACRKSSWRSPREMHVLGEAFFHLNDILSALATAERARQEGSRLLGTYRDAASLERFIETLREELKGGNTQGASTSETGIDD